MARSEIAACWRFVTFAIDRSDSNQVRSATMHILRTTSVWLLLAPAIVAATDGVALTPQAGLLVLRNGHVLAGEITRAGDFYVVTLGSTGEVRMPADEVEFQCASMHEAYTRKRTAITGRSCRSHLELAAWCLRHNLHNECAEQLAAAKELEAGNPDVAALERRLELAQAPVKSERPVAQAVPATTLSSEDLEKKISALPKASVERFSAIVQPILLNRCGANQCHGPNSKSEFRLLKPPTGQAASRRFTQRNLYATLSQIDASNPDASPLLVMPQRRHGTTLTAVFDRHTQDQLVELQKWMQTTLQAPSTPATGQAPGTINGKEATLSQTAAKPADAAEPNDVRVAASDASNDNSTASDGTFVPRDPYDPEIFNRRFFEKR